MSCFGTGKVSGSKDGWDGMGWILQGENKSGVACFASPVHFLFSLVSAIPRLHEHDPIPNPKPGTELTKPRHGEGEKSGDVVGFSPEDVVVGDSPAGKVKTSCDKADVGDGKDSHGESNGDVAVQAPGIALAGVSSTESATAGGGWCWRSSC